MDTLKEVDSYSILISHILRLTYPYLKVEDKRSQQRLLCLSKSIREAIYKDRNVIWKQRFEEITKIVLPPNIYADWSLACKLAKESNSSLYLLNCPEVTAHLEGFCIPPPSIHKSIRESYPVTLRELLKLNENVRVEDLIHTSSNPEILTVLISKAKQISNIPDAILESSKALTTILESDVIIPHMICSSFMINAIEKSKFECLKIFLGDKRVKFREHYIILAMVALNQDNIRALKILLADPKGKGIIRDYSSLVPSVQNKGIAKVIVSHPNVILCENTVRCFRNRFGEKAVNIWLGISEKGRK